MSAPQIPNINKSFDQNKSFGIGDFIVDIFEAYKDHEEDLALEIRCIKKEATKNVIESEVFELYDIIHYKDTKQLELYVKKKELEGFDIYYGGRPRLLELLLEKGKKTASKAETLNEVAIQAIDIDYKKAHSKSANAGTYIEAEKRSKELAEKLIEKLTELDVTPYVVIFSGRGLQLLYVSEQASGNAQELIEKRMKRAMVAVIERIISEVDRTEEWEVDRSIFDLARIFRLPFTMNQKAKKHTEIIYTTNKKAETFEEVVEKFERAAEKLAININTEFNNDVEYKKNEEDFRYELDGDKAEILAKKLYEVIKPLWREGRRHNLALAIAGVLKKYLKMDYETAKKVFDIFLTELERAGLEDEAKDRYLTLVTTYEKKDEEIAVKKILKEKLNFTEKEANDLINKIVNTIKKTTKMKTLTLPALYKMIEKVSVSYDSQVIEIDIYFKNITIPFTFRGKLIKIDKFGEKIVNNDFIEKLDLFLMMYNYYMLLPKKKIHKKDKVVGALDYDKLTEFAVYILKISENKEFTNIQRDIAVDIIEETLKLAEEVAIDETPPSRVSFAYDRNLNELYITNKLLLLTAKQHVSSNTSEDKLARKVLRILSAFRKHDNKKRKTTKKNGENIHYYVFDLMKVEQALNKKIEEFVELVKEKQEREFDFMNEIAIDYEKLKSSEEVSA